jgi:putative polyhydroxyalkanoate system protein
MPSQATLLVSQSSALRSLALRATLYAMSTPITISIPHQLGRAEARRRVETGFAKILRQLPTGSASCSERWEGDQLNFSATGMGQTISGAVDVLDAEVKIRLDLPGLLGMIAAGLAGRIKEAGRLLLSKK